MSGHHRAYQYVDSYEWARLQRLSRDYSRQQTNYQKLLKEARQSTANDLRRIREQSDRQRAQFNRDISNLSAESRAAQDRLSADLNAARTQFAQRLEHQSQQFASDLAGVSNELHHRIALVSEHFEQQNRVIRSAIQRERQEREAQIEAATARIGSLEEAQRQQRLLAQKYFADAAGLCTAISRKPHEHYAPGRLADIEQQLSAARAQFLSVAPQMALGQAYAACDELTGLRQSIEVGEALREQTLAIALEHAQVLVGQLQEFRAATLKATLQHGKLVNPDDVDTSQPTETFALDRELWSGGALSAVSNEVEGLLQLLQNDNLFVSQDTLDTIVQTALPDLTERVSAIDALALQNYQLHREKINFAEIIAAQLDANAFVVTPESDWLQANELGDFVVEAVNSRHEKAVIIIGSVSEPNERPRVTFDYFNYRGDNDMSEDTRAERVRQLIAALEEQGVRLRAGGDHGTEIAAEAPPAFSNVQQLKQDGMTATVQAVQAQAQSAQAQAT